MNETSFISFFFFFSYAFFLTYLLPYWLTSIYSFQNRPVPFQAGGRGSRINLALVFLCVLILCCNIFCYGCMFAFVVFVFVVQYEAKRLTGTNVSEMTVLCPVGHKTVSGGT